MSLFLKSHRFIIRQTSRSGSRVNFPGHHMEVSGLVMGEGFGMSAAACDFNGDGFDDLVVGAPHYAYNQYVYNTGRVHLFEMSRNKLQRIRLNLKSFKIVDFFFLVVKNLFLNQKEKTLSSKVASLDHQLLVLGKLTLGTLRSLWWWEHHSMPRYAKCM